MLFLRMMLLGSGFNQD